MNPNNEGRIYSTPKYNPGILVYHDSWEKPGVLVMRNKEIDATERLGGMMPTIMIVEHLRHSGHDRPRIPSKSQSSPFSICNPRQRLPRWPAARQDAS